jgi:hypothetical protein
VSGRVALSSQSSLPRLLVQGQAGAHEVFDVLGIAGRIVRVRSALLFEVGEQLELRIEQDGSGWDTTARVRGHVGPDDDRITELELADRPGPDAAVP